MYTLLQLIAYCLPDYPAYFPAPRWTLKKIRLLFNNSNIREFEYLLHQ